MARKSCQSIQDIGTIICAYPRDVMKRMAPYLEASGTGRAAAYDNILRRFKRIGPRKRKSRRRA